MMMHKYDTQRLNLLTNLISDHYPSQQILHLSDATIPLHETLYHFTAEEDFEYDLRAVGCGMELFSGLTGDAHSAFSIEPLSLQAKQYSKHAKKYDNLFVTVAPELLQAALSEILKKCYRILKNGAVFAAILPRESFSGIMAEALEMTYFSAVNAIDIFDDYDVVSAKKLHGWGAYEVGFA